MPSDTTAEQQRESQQRALEDCLRDEPQWRRSLWIEELEMPDRPTVSLN